MLNSWNICRSLLAIVILVIVASVSVFADVCVWRNPERTMAKVFPKAHDYKTVDLKISAEKRAAIEQRLGKALDPGERETWTYYEIIGNDKSLLGYIIADAEKGEYGVIEIVMGLSTEGVVQQVYIQRARERDKEFKSKEYLVQFVGKSKEDPLKLGQDLKATATLPTQQVAFGVRKMLIMFDELKTKSKL